MLDGSIPCIPAKVVLDNDGRRGNVGRRQKNLPPGQIRREICGSCRGDKGSLGCRNHDYELLWAFTLKQALSERPMKATLSPAAPQARLELGMNLGDCRCPHDVAGLAGVEELRSTVKVFLDVHRILL